MYDIDDDKCEHYNGKAMSHLRDRELVCDGRTNERKKSTLSLELHAFTINCRFKIWKHTHTHTQYTYSAQ